MVNSPDPTRALEVTQETVGVALGSAVRKLTGLAWTATKKLIEKGHVTVNGEAWHDPGARLRLGQRVQIHTRPGAGTGPKEAQGPVFDRSCVVHVDPHVVVVNKPAGMSTVPFEEGERGALVDRLRVVLHRSGEAPANAPLFVVHRIDKETSGLVVFGRTWLAKRHLAALFRTHHVERMYLAIVAGHFVREETTFETHLVENRGDGLRGSAKQQGLGVRAVTHAKVRARLRGPATLLECRLETGRTHQIRIHLAEAGHPLVGERVYSRGRAGTQLIAPRMMLHAATLGFSHPTNLDLVTRYVVPPPTDFDTLARSLGATDDELRLER